MTDLAGHPTWPAPQPSVEDEPAADTGAGEHAEHIPLSPSRTGDLLTEDADVHVVVDAHLRARQRLLQQSRERDRRWSQPTRFGAWLTGPVA